jgi:hypothetical protein
MRQKLAFSLLLFSALCFLGGCGLPHSVGSKKVAVDPSVTQGTPLTPGKSIYLAVIKPLPQETSDSTTFIVAQFAKNLSGISNSITVGSTVDDTAEGLAAAKTAGAAYLALLQINTWEKAFYLKPNRASLTVTVIDGETEQIRNRATIEATCRAMLVGLESSPRECIRPQVVDWMEKTFNTPVSSTPQGDIKTFEGF